MSRLIGGRSRLSSPSWAVCTALSLLLVTTARAESAGDYDTLRKLILEAYRENTARLGKAHIQWTRESAEDGFIAGRTLTHSGKYEMWFALPKVATSSSEDKLFQQGAGWAKRPGGQRTAFNGKEFRTMPNIENPQDISIQLTVPKYHLHENWLDTTGWNANTSLAPVIVPVKEVKQFLNFDSSFVTEAGQRLLLLRFTPKDNDKSVRRSDFYVDPAKAYSLVHSGIYDSQGRALVELSMEVRQIEGGAWFPVKKDERSLDPSTGKVLLSHHFAVDMDHSQFGSSANFSDDVFEMPVLKGMEISDYRGGVRLNYTPDEVGPLPDNLLHEAVGAFENAKDAPHAPAANPALTPAGSSGLLAQFSDARKRAWRWWVAGAVLCVSGVGIALICRAFKSKPVRHEP